jgi:iron-sulfur cluster assembly protein
MLIASAEALEKIRAKVKDKGCWGVRLQILPSGCNGWSYDLSYLEEPNILSDAVFYGMIAVDPMTFSYVEEIHIDWIEDGLNEQFKISSPQETAQCGCGESFTL